MGHCWCDHRSSFPSLPLGYVFAAEKQSTSVSKYFVMGLGEGELGSHSWHFPLSMRSSDAPCWWIICLMPCCHVRFQFMAFHGTLKQGIDSLVLPLCSTSQGENYVPQNKIGDAVASCCDNVNGAKSPQKQNSFWCRFPWKAMAGRLSGERWGRLQLYQKMRKGSYNNGLYWEIKMVVIVSCTGKSLQGWARRRMWVLCAAGYVQVSWSAGGVRKFISWLLCYLCK